jgi:UDP-N-acetylmuramoyl-tripeptide--D-alanyl-D-alanine ligase
MMSIKLELDDIYIGLGDHLVSSNARPGARFSRAIIDSRQAQPDDLFFALHGEHHDAHDFVQDAFEEKAGGAVVLRPVEAPVDRSVFHVRDPLTAFQRLAAYWRSRHSVRLVGVTGSVGKTTAKEIIASVLSHRYQTLKSTANFNTEIGVPLTLLGLKPEHERAVLELAMYQPGDIRLLCEISRPQVGVVLNIHSVHMERAGSIGRIAAAKAELVESLPPDGLAVLNADDPRVASMARGASCRTITFGLSEQSDVRAEAITSRGLDGFSFTLALPDGSSSLIDCQLPGSHHVYAVLAAAAVALNEGMTLDEIAVALRSARMDLRLTPRRGRNGSTLIDDSYNASPVSMIAALDFLSETGSRRIAVLGHMRELGAAESAGHIAVGNHSVRTSDILVVVGEDAHLIADSASSAGHPDVRRFGSPEDASAHLRENLKAGDHVLIKASRAVGLEALVEALGEA